MPKIVDKQAKSAAILEAAVRVFADKGVVATKMIDIAKEAGIGKGTVYEYFSSKEAIFLEAMNLYLLQFEGVMQETLQSKGDPQSRLWQLMSRVIQDLAELTDVIQIMLDFWAVGLRSEQFNVWRSAYDNFRGIIARTITEGIESGQFRPVNADSAARSLMAVLDGLVFQYIMVEDKAAFLGQLDTIFDVTLGGLTL